MRSVRKPLNLRKKGVSVTVEVVINGPILNVFEGRSPSPRLLHGMSQTDMMYASTIILHLGFWFSLKICKNVWNHIWRSKGTLFIPQPSVWFMITKLLPDPLFENWPQGKKKWKRRRSKDLENLEDGHSWIKCLAWTLLSAPQVHNTFQILRRLFWFWNNSHSALSLDGSG